MTTAFRLAVVALFFPGVCPAADAPVDFNRDVRPILSGTCFQCHGPDEDERKADLRLDARPGDAALAEVLDRVVSKDPSQIMPPPKLGKPLSAKEIDTLTRWVKQGGKYATHWSHVKPTRPPVPGIPARGPIDAFILHRLAAEKLSPSPEADRHTLARRVALDLTGLPPTPAELKAFLADTSPNAYEAFVDRQLAKPAFGEHWARMWLDLARYADSAGYADDPPRTIWKYRDYVINAFNANKPFDVFTVEQIAGDLLPNPTDEQLTATAFHRNTLTNNEGGTSDEEFRNVAVVDRVNTTLVTWMGTSAACAQCHTHKFDPLTQHEYFRLFAFFNNSADADRRDESPLLNFFTPEQLAKRAALEKEIAALDAKLKGQKPDALKPDRDALAAKKKELAAVQPATSVPVMKELPANQRRKTRVQLRGNYLELADEVTEGVPAAFHPLPANAPKNRLTLAKWLIDAENPLTARVVANRFWEQIFGTGLVRTSEEFGSQGEPPSHPELLDFLATELVRTKWDTKAFLRALVTASAYRQTSKVTPAAYERDPDNRLLARGPRVRLSAEAVRDQALFVSGLLSPKMFGPSVKPPQPAMGLSAAFGGSIDWTTSTGEDKHRRGLYTDWRRTNPYPSMSTFDAPNRDICTVRRARTNTPLQALVTMNDTVYIEAAQALARKTLAAPGTPAEKAKFAWELCLCRPATAAEAERLAKLFVATRTTFAKDPAKAKQMATVPIGPAPAGVDVIDLAAWTAAANVLLNLDEMVLKP